MGRTYVACSRCRTSSAYHATAAGLSDRFGVDPVEADTVVLGRLDRLVRDHGPPAEHQREGDDPGGGEHPATPPPRGSRRPQLVVGRGGVDGHALAQGPHAPPRPACPATARRPAARRPLRPAPRRGRRTCAAPGRRGRPGSAGRGPRGPGRRTRPGSPAHQDPRRRSAQASTTARCASASTSPCSVASRQSRRQLPSPAATTSGASSTGQPRSTTVRTRAGQRAAT